MKPADNPGHDSVADRLRAAEAAAEAAAGRAEADEEELLVMASELVAWGSPGPAAKIIALLRRRTDRFEEELSRLREAVDNLYLQDEAFDQDSLAGALRTARDPKATKARLVNAAERLVSWGALDAAEQALDRLGSSAPLRGVVASIRGAAHQLRASGILSDAAHLDSAAASRLAVPGEVTLLGGTGRTDTAAIFFTGIMRRFWVSLQVLHHVLSPYAGHLVYLSDHTSGGFLNGVQSVAPDYRQFLGWLRGELKRRGVARTIVLATSAGGYVGLRAAADLPAHAYAGFSIRSDFSGGLPLNTYDRSARDRCRDPAMLLDLADYLKPRFTPRRIVVHAAGDTHLDRVHAANLSGVKRASIRVLPGERMHDSVRLLISRGEFQPLLDELFAD